MPFSSASSKGNCKTRTQYHNRVLTLTAVCPSCSDFLSFTFMCVCVYTYFYEIKKFNQSDYALAGGADSMAGWSGGGEESTFYEAQFPFFHSPTFAPPWGFLRTHANTPEVFFKLLGLGLNPQGWSYGILLP